MSIEEITTICKPSLLGTSRFFHSFCYVNIVSYVSAPGKSSVDSTKDVIIFASDYSGILCLSYTNTHWDTVPIMKYKLKMPR